jgi:Tol biopolymer transport system component
MSDSISRLNAALEGRYRIERELGEGGMATVYLAEDLKHERKVALKVLRPELAAVIGAERFLSEIRTTAKLQHPHILPLFDSGEADRSLYYVMPFIDGETLRDKLDREKQLGVDEAVAIARSVADALDYAHRNDIIHRDIKPGNVLLHDARPVVADFGIALAVTAAGGGRLTETGLSLGTPHYMSPEQASADRDLSARSDVYSLGCVLYEMIAGQPPHTGPSAQSILVRILTETPRPLTELRHTVPGHVAAAVAKAIEKLPADRFESAKAFMGALEDPGFRYEPVPVGAGGPMAAPAQPAPVTSQRTLVASVAVAAIAVAAALWGWLRTPPTVLEPAVRAVVDLGDVPLRGQDRIVISPDGSRLAFVGAMDGRESLYVRNIGESDFRLLWDQGEIQYPSFSPDGEWIVYEDDQANTLMRIALSGGAPRVVVPASGGEWSRPHWGDDGTIVLVDLGRAILRVPETGGEPTLLAEVAGTMPRLLPGGRGVIYTLQTAIHYLDLGSGESRELIPGGIDAHYVTTGHLVYADESGGVWAQRFDLDAAELRGEPIPVLERVSVNGSHARLSVSDNGTLVFTTGDVQSGFLAGRELLIVGLDGEERVLPLAPRLVNALRWAPDGRRIAFSGVEPGAGPGPSGQMIYVYDVELGTTPRQLTFEGNNHEPIWSLDGSRVVFSSSRSGTTDRDLFVKSVDDDIPPTRILSGAGGSLREIPSHSLEGNRIVFSAGNSSATNGLWTMDVTDSTSAAPYLQVEGSLLRPSVSPQGDLVAYEAAYAGQVNLEVRSFPEARQPVIISRTGGHSARWSPDGSTLYWWREVGSPGAADSLFATTIRRVPTFAVESTRFVLAGPYESPSWDLHPDGDRFIIARAFALSAVAAASEGATSGAATRHFIVTNWFTELLAAVGERR